MLFEKWEVWKKASGLPRHINGHLEGFPQEEKCEVDRQIKRFSISTVSKFVEGTCRIENKEQICYLTMPMAQQWSDQIGWYRQKKIRISFTW